jgi:hypothetical protein
MGSTTYVGEYVDSGSRNGFYYAKGSSRRKYGFKEFQSKGWAEWSYNVQKELSKVNIAPYVFGEVGRISLGHGSLTEWGYLTEVAKEVKPCRSSDCGCDRWDAVENCPIYKRVLELTGIMEDMGLEFNDGHLANFGVVRRKNKRIIVLIDTGVEGFADWDETIWGYVDGRGERASDGCGCSCSYCMGYDNIER